jgi:acetylornithine/succinyldiaminopimelate/putrescine aminotransferase
MTKKYIGRLPDQAIKQEFAAHVSSGKVAFFEAVGIDFIPGKREGAFLWDVTGEKRLINCHCNGGVFNLGHRNPELIEILTRSMQELDVGIHEPISEQRARLAAQLAELTPGDITYTVFGVSGGEAIDLAIKVARGYSGKQHVISAVGGYHGHTGLALYTGDAGYFDTFGPRAPGFEQVPFNDIQALDLAMTAETAAVILETVPATNGILVPEQGYLEQVRELCDNRGVLLIIDEVQTGLGRTGKMWGIDHFGVVPDIMVLGKGLSGGIYPMTATCIRPELETVLKDPFIHISTQGGAEVGVPVVERVLEISSDGEFLQNVRDVAEFFAEGFEQLKDRHPDLLVRLRQLGMMMGIEFSGEFFGPLFSRAAYDNGLLCVYANNDRRVVQFLPPLIIDRPLAAEILQRLDDSLAHMMQLVAQFTA